MSRAKHPHLSDSLSALAEAVEDHRRILRRVGQADALPSFPDAEAAVAWATEFAGEPPAGFAIVARRAVAKFGLGTREDPEVEKRTWAFGLERRRK